MKLSLIKQIFNVDKYILAISPSKLIIIGFYEVMKCYSETPSPPIVLFSLFIQFFLDVFPSYFLECYPLSKCTKDKPMRLSDDWQYDKYDKLIFTLEPPQMSFNEEKIIHKGGDLFDEIKKLRMSWKLVK